MKQQVNPHPFVIPQIPLPVVIISCGSGDNVSLITISWITVLSEIPPRLGISVRPERHSFELLRDHEEMVVNVPDRQLLTATDFCGTHSGKKVCKWDLAGLTRENGSKVQVPMIKECSVNIECRRVGDSMSMGSHRLFVYNVLAGHATEQLPDPKTRPLLFFNGEYWGMGGFLKKLYFSAKQDPEARGSTDLL